MLAVITLLVVASTVGLPGSAVCLEFDAEGDYPDCPPMVIPARQPNSAHLTVEAPNADPGWFHGGFFYMRATTREGQIVLDQRLTLHWDEDAGPAASNFQPPPSWATGEAYLAPGTYELTFYARSCQDGLYNSDGTCQVVNPPEHECGIPITVEPNEEIAIGYDWTIPACGESEARP
jgi:hypothetical protein